MICYGNAFSVTTLWITCVISLMEGRDFTGGWRNRPGSIKARAVEPASASEMKQPHKGMPEIWPCDAASHSLRGNMVTYGNEMPTSKSLPSVDGAQLGQDKKGAMSGVPKANFWKWVSVPKRGESRGLKVIESILIYHRHKLSGLRLL